MPTLLFGLIFGCTLEEEEEITNETETIQNDPKSPFEEAFTLKNFNEVDGVLNGGLDVDWSSPTEKQMKNGQTLYEFKATSIAPTSLESEVQLPDQFFVLGELDESGNVSTWVVKIKPDITAAPIDYSYVNLKDYSGSILHYDLKGNILRMEGWQKGKGISLVENADEPQPNVPDSMAARCQQRSSLTNFGLADPFDPCPGGGGGSWVPIHTDHYTDWYLDRGNGALEYSNTDYNGRTTEYLWVSNGGSSGFYQSRTNYYAYYLSDGTSSQLSSQPSLPIPTKIINKLTGKENCINGQLTLRGYLGAILDNFEGDDSEFNITIESQDVVTHTDENGVTSEVNGVTSFTPGSDEIKIKISTTKAATRPTLSVAKTILHEYIHADIFRKLRTANVDADIRSFRDVYNKYKSQIFTGDAQHETMADLYVGEIASALADYHENALPGDYNFVSNNGQKSLHLFYEALAWQGLRQDDEAA